MTTAQPHIESAAKPNELLRSFIALLNNSHSLQNSVGYYAKRLHTTPQNLNHICQKSRQQSASELIATYIVSEAKRLLFYTDKTVSEIGYALGFKDNSHLKIFQKAGRENTFAVSERKLGNGTHTNLFSNRP